MDKKEWMTVDEVIAHIMQTRRVSRNRARKMMIAAMKKKEIPYKEVVMSQPMPKPLSPDEAVKLFDEAPEEMFIPLSEFKLRANFTNDELMGELRSGRLVASASNNVIVKTELRGEAFVSDFVVDCRALINWMTNPKTPLYLIEKFNSAPRPQ